MVMYSARRSAGFTLIELLIVVVIIGILAAIAMPAYANAKGKSFAGAMRNDLHNLALSQETYFIEEQAYNSSLAALKLNKSPGVSIEIVEATPAGWSAKATHGSTRVVCALFLGAAAPVSPATSEGAIACQD
jgi:type IV pilus assembly protein PilA